MYAKLTETQVLRTNFATEQWTKEMAALPRIHWQRTLGHQTPQTWTLSTTMCGEPCLRNCESWNRNRRM